MYLLNQSRGEQTLIYVVLSLYVVAHVNFPTVSALLVATPPPPPKLPYFMQIKFFKSTMFRKTIESKSLSETRQVWESFIGMTKEAIEKRRPGEASATLPV